MVLYQQLEQGGDASTRDIERLMTLTDDEIDDLRAYSSGLKSSSGRDSSLLSAIRRFVTRFSEATGIAVLLSTPIDIPPLTSKFRYSARRALR